MRTPESQKEIVLHLREFDYISKGLPIPLSQACGVVSGQKGLKHGANGFFAPVPGARAFS
jgi:hypothetical protein